MLGVSLLIEYLLTMIKNRTKNRHPNAVTFPKKKIRKKSIQLDSLGGRGLEKFKRERSSQF